MSVAPKRTIILVKDLLFQEKYHLSHTQTDLMAYFVNLTYWSISVDGYFVIATSKVMSDLPKMGLKTFEASLKALKDLGLVECKIVEVKQWKGKPKVRGLRLTEKGKEYNKNIILPTQDKRVRELEKKTKELERENQKLKETIDNLTVELEEKNGEEPQETIPQPELKLPPKDKVDDFIQETIKQFGANGKPLCNLAPKYNKESIFYINTYNRLSVITPSNDHIQVLNPEYINYFWQWLYLNSHRIGDKIDFSITPTIKQLKDRFVNRTIKIKEEKCTIVEFAKKENGVMIKIRKENGKEGFLIDSVTQKSKVFEFGNCQEVILKLLE